MILLTMASLTQHPCGGRVYSNAGNLPLLSLLSSKTGVVLDVGCGAGDNALLLRNSTHHRVFGLTLSESERRIAADRMEACWVGDVEEGVPPPLSEMRFDVLLFSHVLEHLRQPSDVLRRLSELLNPGGEILIAVPNVLGWRQRWQFLRGRFEYTATGVMDRTHLRFFSYDSADRELIDPVPGLRLTDKTVTGSVPLWFLRKIPLLTPSVHAVDRIGCRRYPNLFGGQVLLRAVKAEGAE